MRWISGVMLIVLVGCGGGGGHRGGAGAIEHLGPDETPPGDGLVVIETNQESIMDCARHDLAVRVASGGQIRDEVLLEGSCQGVCTPEDKAAGEALVAEIEAGIASGDRSESELDYNFTECVFHGVVLGRLEEAAGRTIALLAGETPGPHDIPNTYFHVAAEACGKVFVGESFGSTYSNRWSLTDLKVATEGTDTAVVVVDDEGTPRELYRVTFGAECASPAEVVGDSGEY